MSSGQQMQRIKFKSLHSYSVNKRSVSSTLVQTVYQASISHTVAAPPQELTIQFHKYM